LKNVFSLAIIVIKISVNNYFATFETFNARHVIEQKTKTVEVKKQR